MKTIIITPGAKRLMGSLRNIGYDCSTAIADLVDNSITARASEVHIDIIPKNGNDPAAIVISDNGNGMSKEELQEAMRLGSEQSYEDTALGKYGLGLKTASLSQCHCLTVSSKGKPLNGSRPRRNCVRWDLDYIYKKNEWALIIWSEDEQTPWEKKILSQKLAEESGTVVLWTDLNEPLLATDDKHKQERFIAKLVNDISMHLGMVFHRFMQGQVTGYKKLKIIINGDEIAPWDPFCNTESTVNVLDILKLSVINEDLDGAKVEQDITITPYILPREDEFSYPSVWKRASGPKGWNDQQGFYFYRNNRLLQAGGWSRIRKTDEHTKLLRIAVDFSSDLDLAFAINVTKMRAKFPSPLTEAVQKYSSMWIKKARARYDNNDKTEIDGNDILDDDDSDSQVEDEEDNSDDDEGAVIPSSEAQNSNESNPSTHVTFGPFILNVAKNDIKEIEITQNSVNGLIEFIVPQNHEIIRTINSSDYNKRLDTFIVTLVELLKVVNDGSLKISNTQLELLKEYIQQLR